MKHARVMIAMTTALVAGCVHVEQDLVIRADGSGELRVQYAAKEQDVKRMRLAAAQMAALDPARAPSGMDWLTAFDEEAIRREWKKHAGPGTTLHQVDTRRENGWQVMRAAIQFDSLQQLLDCGMIDHVHIALTRGPQGQYGYQQTIAVQRIMQSLPGSIDVMSFEPVASMMMRDLEAKFRVEVPGAITRGNAERVEGRRAIWEISGSQPDAWPRLRELDLRLIFDGRALNISDARTVK